MPRAIRMAYPRSECRHASLILVASCAARQSPSPAANEARRERESAVDVATVTRQPPVEPRRSVEPPSSGGPMPLHPLVEAMGSRSSEWPPSLGQGAAESFRGSTEGVLRARCRGRLVEQRATAPAYTLRLWRFRHPGATRSDVTAQLIYRLAWIVHDYRAYSLASRALALLADAAGDAFTDGLAATIVQSSKSRARWR